MLTYIEAFRNGDTTPPSYSPDDAGLAPIGDVHSNAAGCAVIADQIAAGSPAAVPESSTWSALLVGMGAVGAAPRKRRTRQPARVSI